jgi:hypothetical protein
MNSATIYIYIYRERERERERELCYSVSEVLRRYLRFSLILAVNFYYIINKLIILIYDPH